MNAPPTLLIVIPCLNEEAHLPALLTQLREDAFARNARIVVADGGSVDRSIEIVRAHAAADPRVVLMPNPKRIQSAAVNAAVRAYGAGADMMVRVDAHAGYPDGFLARLLEACTETSADTVTVSMRAVSHTSSCFQRANAEAQNTVLGAGGSPHRSGGTRRWVDHGHHALFRLAAFTGVGGYDESFTHNEDAELDQRIRAKDGKILLAGDIVIDYFPRTSARALARQYFMFGRGRARTMLKHRSPLKLRQLALIGVAPALLMALAAPLLPVLAAPAAAWLTICLVYGALLGLRARNLCAAFAGIPAAVMHLAWSAGFCRELIAQIAAAPTAPRLQSRP